jgi:hypothetical protein
MPAESPKTDPHSFRRRAAITVVMLAVVLAVGSLLAGGALKHGKRQATAPPVASSKPAIATSSSHFCASYPSLPRAKPDAINTGVPSGTTLTHSGSLTVTKPGTVINSVWLKGTLTISANNVTVENSKIEAAISGWYGIDVAKGVTGTRVIYNEIWGDSGGYIGINAPSTGSAANYTFICGNHLHNWENGITCGPNMMVQANFIDAMQNHQNDSDADGIENYYGGNTRFWGNNILAYGVDGSSTAGINSALNITATGVNIDNVQVNGNWLGGGGTTLDLDQQMGATAKNVSVTNNTWYETPPPLWYPVGDHSSRIVSAWSRNTFSNGTPISK